MRNRNLLYVPIIISLILLVLLTSCNRQILDLNYSFKYAVIDGVGEIEISSWTDYDESDMIQVTGKDGTTYLTHSSKVILKSK